jgi:hypothetical protein
VEAVALIPPASLDQRAEERVDPESVREVGVVLAVLCIPLHPAELRARNAKE